MLETKAIVIKIQGLDALVESKGGGGCGQCDTAGGCGSSKLTQVFCSKPRQFLVKNQAQAKVGDEVQIELQNGVLLRSALLIYVLPLACLIAGGMLGSGLADEASARDGFAALGAFFGLVGGFLLAKWEAKKQSVSAVASQIIV